MKYFVNAILAFAVSWISRSIIYYHVDSPLMQKMTYWIYDVPLEAQTFVLWILFSFSEASGRVLNQIGNGLLNLINFSIRILSQVVEQLWKSKPGKAALGFFGLYLIYYFFIR